MRRNRLFLMGGSVTAVAIGVRTLIAVRNLVDVRAVRLFHIGAGSQQGPANVLIEIVSAGKTVWSETLFVGTGHSWYGLPWPKMELAGNAEVWATHDAAAPSTISLNVTGLYEPRV